MKRKGLIHVISMMAATLLLLQGCQMLEDTFGNGDLEPINGTDTAYNGRDGDYGVHTPAQIEWRAGPPSLPEGAQWAVLEGDPSQEGYFSMRLRLPAGYVIPPHWHPVPERVTVISGDFRLGMGESLERTAAQLMPPGSYLSMPPGMRHFAFTDEGTEIQLNSIGPWEIHYVNPQDDPRGARTQ